MPPSLASRRAPLLAACFAGLFLLLAACLWAGSQSNLQTGLRAIASQPWGLVTLLDLYIGFAIVAAAIYAAESRKPVAVLWIVAILFLGNLITLIWLIQRILRSPSASLILLK